MDTPFWSNKVMDRANQQILTFRPYHPSPLLEVLSWWLLALPDDNIHQRWRTCIIWKSFTCCRIAQNFPSTRLPKFSLQSLLTLPSPQITSIGFLWLLRNCALCRQQALLWGFAAASMGTSSCCPAIFQKLKHPSQSWQNSPDTDCWKRHKVYRTSPQCHRDGKQCLREKIPFDRTTCKLHVPCQPWPLPLSTRATTQAWVIKGRSYSIAPTFDVLHSLWVVEDLS